MSLIAKIKGIGGEWLFKVAIKRIGAAASGAVLGLLADEKVANFLINSGVEIRQETLKAQVATLITLGAVGLHDWLRLKYKWM